MCELCNVEPWRATDVGILGIVRSLGGECDKREAKAVMVEVIEERG